MDANAYLAVPIGAVFALPVIFAIYQLMERYPELNLIEVGLKICGPILGRALGLIYLFALLITLVIFTRDTINLVFEYIMNDTPLLVLAVTYLSTAAYLASRELETISRLASFVILPALAVILLLMIGVLMEISINRILPVFYPGITQYLLGGASVLHGFYPLGLIGLVTPYLRQIRRKVPRLTLSGILIIVLYYALFTIGTIGIYGHEYLARFAYPGLDAIHAVEFPYLLIEQAGLLMVIAWITIVMIGSSFHYYSLGLGLWQVSGFWNYKRFVWLLWLLKLCLIMFPQNVGETKEFSQLAAGYGWIILFGFPVFLYLWSLLFKKAGGKDKD